MEKRYNEKIIDLMPPIFREKYGSRKVKQWETGNDPISHTVYQEDSQGRRRLRGTMPGCFWTDWQ